MKTEHRLAEALKTMMSEMPLDSISVTLLSKKCHINRQTFYYHFHDIYDLLTLVFLNEKIPNAEEAKTTNDLVKCVYDYYNKNSGFINATLSSAGKDLFQEFIYNTCYKTILKIVGATPDGKKLTVNDKKSISRFYALAYANTILYYLLTYKNKSLNGLLNCFCFVDEKDVLLAIAKCLAVKGKHD